MIQSNLLIRGVQLDQTGFYYCKNDKNNKLSPVHHLTVQIPVKAKINAFEQTNLETKVVLNCSFFGNPEPKVYFFKDGHEINDNPNTPILGQKNYSYIILDKTKIQSEESFYECKISNRWNEDKKNLLVKFGKKPDFQDPQLPSPNKGG